VYAHSGAVPELAGLLVELLNVPPNKKELESACQFGDDPQTRFERLTAAVYAHLGAVPELADYSSASELLERSAQSEGIGRVRRNSGTQTRFERLTAAVYAHLGAVPELAGLLVEPFEQQGGVGSAESEGIGECVLNVRSC
jgi:hypothetical protein